jgi:hypothetical protein
MIEEIALEQVYHGIDRVLPLVRRQREKQIEKWGVQEHDPAMWYAILGEEFGEVGKEIAEGRIKDFDVAKYRKECLHTAAVALAMVQCIDDGSA